MTEISTGVRLQKVLAEAGLGSRRSCERLIEQGRVEVDGQPVRHQGMRLDPARAVIRVDGLRVGSPGNGSYLALNKPRGVVSTMRDPRGRPCLGDLLGERSGRIFHVGRLDADTEGLLLLTSDGELGHRLAHPSWQIPRTYLAEVPGPLGRDVGRRLRSGVELDDGPARVDAFRPVDTVPGCVLVELVLHEGRRHEVRRLLEAVGHPVRRLVRTSYGPVRLAQLRPGRIRRLTRAEIGALYAAVGM